jgi:hypothetical protein
MADSSLGMYVTWLCAVKLAEQAVLAGSINLVLQSCRRQQLLFDAMHAASMP